MSAFSPFSLPATRQLIPTSLAFSRNVPLSMLHEISHFRTLSFSVSSKSFACHSYENCRVYPNNSQCGTATRNFSAHKLQSGSFFSYSCTLFCKFLHFFVLSKTTTLFFSWDCALFDKNTGVGGRMKPSSSPRHDGLRMPETKEAGKAGVGLLHSKESGALLAGQLESHMHDQLPVVLREAREKLPEALKEFR